MWLVQSLISGKGNFFVSAFCLTQIVFQTHYDALFTCFPFGCSEKSCPGYWWSCVYLFCLRAPNCTKDGVQILPITQVFLFPQSIAVHLYKITVNWHTLSYQLKWCDISSYKLSDEGTCPSDCEPFSRCRLTTTLENWPSLALVALVTIKRKLGYKRLPLRSNSLHCSLDKQSLQ